MADSMTISLGNNTLKDSTKIKDTATISSNDFTQLGRVNRKSIVAMAKSNIFEFPVFMSDTVRKDYVDPANCLLEQVYMSYMQMAFSISQVVSADMLETGQQFQRFKTDTNKYLEYTDMSYAHDACHNVIEAEGYVVECDMISLPDNINKVITEFCAHEPLSEFNHYFQEADNDDDDDDDNDGTDEETDNDNGDDNTDEETDEDSNGTPPSEDAMNTRGHQSTTVRRTYWDDNGANVSVTTQTLSKAERDALDEQRKTARAQELRARERHEVDTKVKSAQLVDESKIQKLNTMKPLMMTVNFRVVDENRGLSRPVEYVVGIKTHTRIIDSSILPEMAKYPLKEMNKLSRKAKWRAGEINFFEYLFNIKGKKQTAVDSKDPKRKWYRRLYELAHSGNDIVAQRQLTGQSFLNRLNITSNKTGDKKYTLTANAVVNEFDGVMPNATLVVSMDDVNNIKHQTDIDLLKGSTAKKLCKEMFLLGIIVIDSDEESLKMMLPDIHDDYEVHSLAALNRQLATLDTSGVSASDISKILGRNR